MEEDSITLGRYVCPHNGEQATCKAETEPCPPGRLHKHRVEQLVSRPTHVAPKCPNAGHGRLVHLP